MEEELIGVSQNISKIRELIDQVADTGLNTVIYGETGNPIESENPLSK